MKAGNFPIPKFLLGFFLVGLLFEDCAMLSASAIENKSSSVYMLWTCGTPCGGERKRRLSLTSRPFE